MRAFTVKTWDGRNVLDDDGMGEPIPVNVLTVNVEASDAAGAVRDALTLTGRAYGRVVAC